MDQVAQTKLVFFLSIHTYYLCLSCPMTLPGMEKEPRPKTPKYALLKTFR